MMNRVMFLILARIYGGAFFAFKPRPHVWALR